MAYAGKHTWATGDTITADNLNNIEDGIEEQVNALNTHFPATGKLVVGTGKATADYAVAVGHNTQANAPAAHAEGYMTKATGDRAHSEGVSTTASGWVSHAEGSGTMASGDSSHAENSHTIASGNASHAEGANTQASGHYSHAEGYYTRATHKAQHVFGEFNVLDDSSSTASNRGNYVEIIGNGTDANARSNARTLDWNGNEELAGDITINKGSENEAKVSEIADDVSTLKNELNTHFPATGKFVAGAGNATANYAVAEGNTTTASGRAAHAEGERSTASGAASHAEGNGSQATAEAAHAEGCARAGEKYAHAEGNSALASGHASHAEGAVYEVESDGAVEEHITTASGKGSHAEGSGTRASGVSAHAEGAMTEATGESAHAEGSETVASGDGAHAEGQKTEATGYYSHAEGVETAAHALAAHAEGLESWAIGWYSHAQGQGTTAGNRSQHVMGEFNEDDPSSASSNERGMYAEIVGNGTSDTARSNARTLDWSGNEELAGDLTINKGGANEASVSEIASDIASLKEIPISKHNSSDVIVTRDLYIPGAINFMNGNTLYQKVPGSLIKTILDWYVEEHGGTGKTPLSRIDSMTIGGNATLTAAFDPSVTSYSGSFSSTASSWRFSFTNAVPHMSGASLSYGYSKISGSASINAGASSWNITNWSGVLRLQFWVICNYCGESTKYVFNITMS